MAPSSSKKLASLDPYLGAGQRTVYESRFNVGEGPAPLPVGGAAQVRMRFWRFPEFESYAIAAGSPQLSDHPTESPSPIKSQSEHLSRTSNSVAPLSSGRVYEIPRIELPARRFRGLQHWRGTVVEINEDGFDAELRNQTDSSRSRESATFQMDELSEGDERLVKVGAVFNWHIGYEMTASRQRKLVSTIIFRRLPAWTEREIADVKRRAVEIEELFGIETSTSKAARS